MSDLQIKEPTYQSSSNGSKAMIKDFLPCTMYRHSRNYARYVPS